MKKLYMFVVLMLVLLVPESSFGGIVRTSDEITVLYYNSVWDNYAEYTVWVGADEISRAYISIETPLMNFSCVIYPEELQAVKDGLNKAIRWCKIIQEKKINVTKEVVDVHYSNGMNKHGVKFKVYSCENGTVVMLKMHIDSFDNPLLGTEVMIKVQDIQTLIDMLDDVPMLTREAKKKIENKELLK